MNAIIVDILLFVHGNKVIKLFCNNAPSFQKAPGITTINTKSPTVIVVFVLMSQLVVEMTNARYNNATPHISICDQ